MFNRNSMIQKRCVTRIDVTYIRGCLCDAQAQSGVLMAHLDQEIVHKVGGIL